MEAVIDLRCKAAVVRRSSRNVKTLRPACKLFIFFWFLCILGQWTKFDFLPKESRFSSLPCSPRWIAGFHLKH